MNTRGSYVHKPVLNFLGHPNFFFILMVLDKMIPKALRIHKTINKRHQRIFNYAILYQIEMFCPCIEPAIFITICTLCFLLFKCINLALTANHGCRNVNTISILFKSRLKVHVSNPFISKGCAMLCNYYLGLPRLHVFK